jgi:hypothetical protein
VPDREPFVILAMKTELVDWDYHDLSLPRAGSLESAFCRDSKENGDGLNKNGALRAPLNNQDFFTEAVQSS